MRPVVPGTNLYLNCLNHSFLYYPIILSILLCFQFVPFREFIGGKYSSDLSVSHVYLAKEVLAEIPDQILRWMEKYVLPSYNASWENQTATPAGQPGCQAYARQAPGDSPPPSGQAEAPGMAPVITPTPPTPATPPDSPPAYNSLYPDQPSPLEKWPI